MARAKTRVDKKRVDIPDIPNYKSLDIRPYLLFLLIIVITSVTLATFMKPELLIKKSPIIPGVPTTYYVDAVLGNDNFDGINAYIEDLVKKIID